MIRTKNEDLIMQRSSVRKIRPYISIDPEADFMAKEFGEKIGMSKSEVYENAVRYFVGVKSAGGLVDKLAGLREKILKGDG